jgi:hypothetical protein
MPGIECFSGGQRLDAERVRGGADGQRGIAQLQQANEAGRIGKHWLSPVY